MSDQRHLPDGYYWRWYIDEYDEGPRLTVMPVEVRRGRLFLPGNSGDYDVEDDGQWLGPCVAPPVPPDVTTLLSKIANK